MDKEKLQKTVSKMLFSGKGLLAMDESINSCCKRFKEVGIECNEENRRKYRQMIITADGLEKYISGFILFDETIRQVLNDGEFFHKIISEKGAVVGIKVDKGAYPLALHDEEKVTEGLDGLRSRLSEYSKMGAEFTKWRAVISISNGKPTDACIYANAHAMARFAALSQESDMVPIVEPEIILEGNYGIEENYKNSSRVLQRLFEELSGQGVYLPGVILKTNMILPGENFDYKPTPEKVAEETIKCFRENVPEQVGGIVFLSGGQSDEEAVMRLNAIAKIAIDNAPWPITFSYSRAIQRPALKIWSENQENPEKAQEALIFRSSMCSLASKGEYSQDFEKNKPY